MSFSPVVSSASAAETRPWGSSERLALNHPVTVNIISVDPGHLRPHISRDEWLSILDSGLYAEIGSVTYVLDVGERMYLESGTKYRVGNNGAEPGRFLEITFGSNDQSENERLEDNYSPIPPRPAIDTPGQHESAATP